VFAVGASVFRNLVQSSMRHFERRGRFFVQSTSRFPHWVFTERAECGTAARAAGGKTVIPQPEAPRRRREVVPQPPPPASSPPSQPFDPQASFAAIKRAIERLHEAEAAAVQTNARVVEAIRNRFG
jgi:hypothetical protein